MDGTPRDPPIKDRPFDPSRIPISAAATRLVSDVLGRLAAAESRQRARRGIDNERYQRLVAALVTDLAYSHVYSEGVWLRVPLSKSTLRQANRQAPFVTEKLRDLVHALASPSVGLAELRPGYRTPFGGVRSTLRATPALAALIDSADLQGGDFGRDPELLGDPLVLRGEKVREVGRGKPRASDLPLPESEHVQQLRQQMLGLNRWIAQADLGWNGCEVTDQVDVGNRFLRRIFNNGSLEQGGRLYGGFWQQVSKWQRLESLLIAGRRVVSLDFAQMSLRVVYASLGLEPPAGDLYAIPMIRGERAGIKMVTNALLAADSLPSRFPACVFRPIVTAHFGKA